LSEHGYQKVDFHEGADVYVINTCSVTDNADKKCRKIVKEALRHNENAFVSIIGCYAQLKPQEIAQIPGVDLVLGAAEKFNINDYIGDGLKKEKAEIKEGKIKEVIDYHSSYSIGDRTRTFLKVQDGCDYFCSFCTIPLARGKSRSDTIENVVKQAQEIVAQGIKEIVLTGVNTGEFGSERTEGATENFYQLLRALEQVKGLERLRVSSIEPNLLSNEIIELAAKSKVIVPHFHIPLQSGSDELLKSMRRKYLTNLYTSRVEKIKALMPHACIGVDVIIGYPGETDAHFLETYNYLNELDISYLHVFTYSERVNTTAYKLPVWFLPIFLSVVG
jgi:threonylcarbamoyladenosine tRNA methylthiotransferase MtaB